MDPNQDEKLAEVSRKRVSQFSGNVLYITCTPDKLDELKQFGGTLKVEKKGSLCRGVWIFASKKEALFALSSLQGDDVAPDIRVQEYSPFANDACFTKLRVTGIPSSGTILDVAKLAPKADHITIRAATDSIAEEAGSKVAIVSFKCKDECVETFQMHESAEMKGKPVCVFFERKKGDGGGKKRKQTENGGTANRVVGFGAKGKGRGLKRKESDA